MSRINDSTSQNHLPNQTFGSHGSSDKANKANENGDQSDSSLGRDSSEARSSVSSNGRNGVSNNLPLSGQMLRYTLHSQHKQNQGSKREEEDRDSFRHENGFYKYNNGQAKGYHSSTASLKAESAEVLLMAETAQAESAAPETALNVLHRGLQMHAAQTGLPPKEQEAFAEEHSKKFEADAKAKGLGHLLEKKGDFSLLSNERLPVSVKVAENQFQLRLGNEAAADLRERTEKLGVKFKENVEVQIKTQVRVGQHESPTASATRASFASLSGSANLNSSNLRSVAVASHREVSELRGAINHKVGEILQRIGVNSPLEAKGTQPKEVGVRGRTFEEVRLAARYLGSNGTQAADNALFASALGIAGESANQSRSLHGDGVLLEFANYGDSSAVLAFEKSLLDFVQSDTKTSFAELIEAANIDSSEGASEALAQVAGKLDSETTSNLVIGVVTMSVMTREVLERLHHISNDSSIGLSDDALMALQKASNSLRDHLTTTDLVGAVGDAKGSPVSINGSSYDFLTEVNEALNSLREARSRVLYESSGVSGLEANGRFVFEANALFQITCNIEKLLKI